jgi:Flp pilus assembly protein TadG
VVEFALIIVPLMLLLLGAVQFGVIWATQIGVTNAVRDSVRAASLVQPKADAAGNVTQISEQTYATGIKTDVLKPAMAANIPFYGQGNVQSATICYSNFADASGGTALQATVTVTYAHPIFIPLIAGVLGETALATTASLSIPVGLDKPYVLSSGVSGCSTWP